VEVFRREDRLAPGARLEKPGVAGGAWRGKEYL